MNICLDCENIFEQPKEYTETHGFDSPPYETWSGCPYCSGTYVETMLCDECGEWIAGEYVCLKSGAIICNNCYTIKDIADI